MKTIIITGASHGIIVSSLDPGWVQTDMGCIGATETEKPERAPSQPADEIFHLVTHPAASGHFWRRGKRREW